MKIGQYAFTCRLIDKALLPVNKGSTFRGLLGHALKQVTCTLRRQDCATCLLLHRCAYPLFFETNLVINLEKETARQSGPPKPYIIEAPLTSQQAYNTGEPLDFSVFLFGRANEYLPYLVYAFKYLGELGIGKKIDSRRARFALETVRFEGNVIYSVEDDLLKSVEPTTLNFAELSGPKNGLLEATVNFETPLRSKFHNELTADLPFHVLVRTLLRRVSALESVYGEGEPDLDYAGLTRNSQEVKTTRNNLTWFEWQRYSSRQGRKMWMGGLTGSITYSGSLTPYSALLKYGQIVHIGKQTTFGLGKYRLV